MNDAFFRTPFALTTFQNKYKHEGCETWDLLAGVLVEDVCRDHLSQSDKDQLKRIITEMKFIPGGRYLYYAGRPFKAFNNCLAKETNILTDAGWQNLQENVGKVLNVLSPVDGQFYPAEIVHHGKQKLNKITFSTLKGHQNHTWIVRATRTHHWPLTNGKDTYDIRIGDIVPANTFEYEFDLDGFAHGMTFGDGNKHGQLRLCAEKDKKHLSLLSEIATITYPESSNGDPVLYFGYKKCEWKKLPDKAATPSYIASFIKGWLAADGNEISNSHKLCSVNLEAIEWFRKYAPYAGLVITGKLRSQIRDIILGENEYKNHTIYIQNYQYAKSFSGFKVVDIQEDIEEDVFCPYEPVHNRFIIDNNIDTFNCYLLRSEEDTREDWAMTSWKSESCLTTGGGIGNNYSIYRPKGSRLNRTGGVASGPISKAKMINEIGREVMQGGSRRSAIYGSLHWKHADAWDWLHAKDWKNMKVAGTEYTYADLKEKDFNFPAPLDMTNISLNYDTEWLENYKKTGEVGDTFIENVKMALSTGEPGFSFNFYEKENETLRNACTEVSSEDDSDVCNLGSVNLSRIQSKEELAEVVDLAIKFLLCGTLVADLPYEKVYKVREKNRRLGLGLMGVHEWLLQRGHKYEIVPDLHEWLTIYRDVSDSVGDSFADELGVSRPKAKRAIAPNGTIGILAATTTSAEPLFAKAFKRRYFTAGHRWKYQYVIDGTTKLLVNEYGLNPDQIESAIDLAKDYERRIKFQADLQDYVDMAISSTINLPSWGSELNNESHVKDFALTLAKYAGRLRGFTVYPDGARGGQPLTEVPYEEALANEGKEYEEEFFDLCEISGKGGTCGI